jgi:hypothetical protein
MNYTLAKELKEAGFPQEERHAGNAYQWDAQEITDDGKEHVYYPTLEELIEACGYSFKSIQRHKTKVSPEGDEWCVVFRQCKGKFRKVWGKTAIEAVAKLWLAINKK